VTPKGATSPKVGASLKAALSKVVFAPPRAKLNIGTSSKTADPPKAGTSKAVVKAVTHVGFGAVSGSAVTKAIAARPQGAQSTVKVGMLKLKTGMKRPAGVEPSVRQAAKQSKTTQKPATPLSPVSWSGDERVEYCSMLGVPSIPSSSSSSTSTSASESFQASPPNLDSMVSPAALVTESLLPSIPEIVELDAAQAALEQGRAEPIEPMTP
jgi:hypothetical protein